jgi:NAD(P)H-flavin reductase
MGLDLVDMIWEEGDGINFERFVPYEVVSNRKVTATSFILTVQPKFFPKSPLPYFLPDGSWWDFVWSVQVKQPELQIQREYTPLPPFDEGLDQRAFFLRFFIRRVDGGEVSRYLSKLQPGDEVELRMAKPQYDFSYRGTNVPDRVSIIASGTGIATALQIAHILLKDKRRVHPDTSVRMFWLHRDVREFYADNNIYESCNLIAYDGQKFELPPKLPLTTIGVAVRRLMQRDGERFWAQFYDFPDEKFAQMVIDMDKVDELKRSGVAPASYPAVLPRRLAASCKAVTNGQYPLQESHLELPEEIHNPYFVIGPEPFVERFAGRLVKKPGQEPRREGGLLGYLIPKKVQEHQGKEPGPAEFVVGMV